LNSSGIAAVFDEGAKFSANMIVSDPSVGGHLARYSQCTRSYLVDSGLFKNAVESCNYEGVTDYLLSHNRIHSSAVQAYIMFQNQIEEFSASIQGDIQNIEAPIKNLKDILIKMPTGDTFMSGGATFFTRKVATLIEFKVSELEQVHLLAKRTLQVAITLVEHMGDRQDGNLTAAKLATFFCQFKQSSFCFRLVPRKQRDLVNAALEPTKSFITSWNSNLNTGMDTAEITEPALCALKDIYNSHIATTVVDEDGNQEICALVYEEILQMLKGLEIEGNFGKVFELVLWKAFDSKIIRQHHRFQVDSLYTSHNSHDSRWSRAYVEILFGIEQVGRDGYYLNTPGNMDSDPNAPVWLQWEEHVDSGLVNNINNVRV
jgi:hypothetical protein